MTEGNSSVVYFFAAGGGSRLLLLLDVQAAGLHIQQQKNLLRTTAGGKEF